MAKGKCDLRLTVAVDEVLLYSHLGVMADQAFDHGRDLGVGEALGLRVDAYRVGFHVPVNHDAIAPIPRPPLGHGILFPTFEAGAIRSTTTLPPWPQISGFRKAKSLFTTAPLALRKASGEK